MRKQEIQDIFINTNLDKVCFQLDMAYGDFKYLPRRTFSDKVLRGKTFNIEKNKKYYGYQRGLTSMLYTFFDKTSAGVNTSVDAVTRVWSETLATGDKSAIMQNQELQIIY